LRLVKTQADVALWVGLQRLWHAVAFDMCMRCVAQQSRDVCATQATQRAHVLRLGCVVMGRYARVLFKK
jgi:hypothetical protein